MSEYFLRIFNTAVTAGWLVLAVLLVRLLLKKAPAWIKCALWAIVGLRLVWPFEIESVLSAVPSTQTIPPAALYDPVPEVHTGINYLNSAINPGFAQTFQPVPSASVNPLQVATTVAAWVWIAGIIAMLAYMAYSYLRLRRLVVVRMPIGEGVYLCDRVESPFILGLIRPKIYLPSDLPKEKWDSILAHERAHIARRDHWWKPLGFLLLTVFWFHPLLWLAYVLLCRDVELACDEKVIRTLSPEEKQLYSQTLLECSLPRRWIAACPLAFGETGVKARIKAVLHYKKPTLWILIVALVLCTVLVVCFLTDPADQISDHEYELAGKTFVYENEGCGIALFSEFTVSFYSDGTFSYYEGGLSSHIGTGTWSVSGNILRMAETRGNYLSGPRECAYYFLMADNMLIYMAEKSDPFTYVDVADGERFYAVQIHKPGESQTKHLMWVQIEQYHDDYMYIRDGNGNCWKVIVVGGVNRGDFVLDQCWFSYAGTPVEIRETLPDGSNVKYQTMGECWWFLECPSGVDETKLGKVYDYTYYDVDEDGEVEICVLSPGHTSGLSTFIFSVWVNGVCEYEKWIYEAVPSRSVAFLPTEHGLVAMNSSGKYYSIVHQNGGYSVLGYDLP